MATIKITLQRTARADLKRSYDKHRTHFLDGDIPKKWGPKFRYYQFERFEDLLADSDSALNQIVQGAIKETPIQDLETVDITLTRPSRIGYLTNGNYDAFRSTPEKVIICMPSWKVFAALYADVGEGEDADSSMVTAKIDLKDTLNHELRHHIDRKQLLASKKLSKRFPLPRYDYNDRDHILEASAYCLNHLGKVRIEGFATFNGMLEFRTGDIKDWLAQLNEENYQARADGFLSNLRLQTETVTKVFDYLSNSQNLTWPSIWENIEYARQDNNPLHLPRNFSPYSQGSYMFQVIGLANLKKRRGGSMGSLFQHMCLPKEIQTEVYNQALAQTSLNGFYDLFYACADSIELGEDRIIIPRTCADRYLALEREAIEKIPKISA